MEICMKFQDLTNKKWCKKLFQKIKKINNLQIINCGRTRLNNPFFMLNARPMYNNMTKNKITNKLVKWYRDYKSSLKYCCGKNIK